MNRVRRNRGRQLGAVCLLTALAISFAPHLAPAATTNLLAAWLSSQTNIDTWAADVVQTRTLKALTHPLVSTGRVWFAAPNRFRWELGDPPQTIAVRQPEQMLVLYPRLKRAERYPLGGETRSPWKDTLALLETGFPRSDAELTARFNIASQSVSNGTGVVVLRPKSPAARRLMPQLQIEFAPADQSLLATEIEFSDGSRLRNAFQNSRLNLRLEETLFNPSVEGMIVSEPFSGSR